MGIKLSSHMHINDFYLLCNVKLSLGIVGLSSSPKLDCIYLILGEMHDSVFIHSVINFWQVGIWTESGMGLFFIQVKFI